MLAVQHLSKRFPRQRVKALDDVSFEIDEGQIFGLLGHNGAGKSTAVGIMLGMIYPDQGEVSIAGHSVLKSKSAALRETGAIFEAPHFYDYLTGWKNLEVLTSFSRDTTRAQMEEIVEWVGLKGRIHDRVQTYSHGMRARLALAQALLPRPKFLLLDEPTNGLDPDGIVEFRRQIRDMRDQFGLTILLCSHLLGEVEQVCDRVAILRDGQKVYEGECRNLNRESIRYRIVAEGNSDLDIPDAKPVEKAPGLFDFPSDQCMPEVLASLVREGHRIQEFTPIEASLEDIYLNVRHS